jgi:hypothetical protein
LLSGGTEGKPFDFAQGREIISIVFSPEMGKILYNQPCGQQVQ